MYFPEQPLMLTYHGSGMVPPPGAMGGAPAGYPVAPPTGYPGGPVYPGAPQPGYPGAMPGYGM